MGLSAWVNVKIRQQATCDHLGTSGPAQAGMVACSACGSSWPVGANAPKATVTREVDYPSGAATAHPA